MMKQKRKKISKKQLKVIRYNYYRKSINKDRKTIIYFLLGTPSLATVFLILWSSTNFIFFLIGSILLFILEGILVYQALMRTKKRLIKRFS